MLKSRMKKKGKGFAVKDVNGGMILKSILDWKSNWMKKEKEFDNNAEVYNFLHKKPAWTPTDHANPSSTYQGSNDMGTAEDPDEGHDEW